MRTIIVRDYDPLWAEDFQRLKRYLDNVLAGLDYRIEHVGSTSVPGLAAKPVIDMDILVRSAGELKKVIPALEKAGYEYRGDLGLEGREAFGVKNKKGAIPEIVHNLYACIDGIPAVRNHLILRDYLRAHPDAAAEYGALKKKLAEIYPHDIDAYVEGKTEFITSILKNGGFDDDELEEISEANRKK